VADRVLEPADLAWTNGSLHHELHGHEDARARSTFLLQILILAAMGAFIPQAGGARGAAFAVASAVLFAVLTVLWLLAARGDRPEYRALVLLLGIPWGYAVAHRLANPADSPTQLACLRSGCCRDAAAKTCARGTTPGLGFVTSDQWTNGAPPHTLGSNER
jgi:Bacterial low temperature requirement A protein (LtrA)